MAIGADERRRILRAARRWLNTPYDYSHADVTWRDPSATPSCFDCSTFVCRVAMDALGYTPELLAPSAAWLIENLIEIHTPTFGDLVGYGREATGDESSRGHQLVWHVMLYAGNGMVIGACDVAGRVTIRPIDYAPQRWEFAGDPPAPFRVLELRRA